MNLTPTVVFYHVEKCGGSSLEASLYHYFQHLFHEHELYVPDKNNFGHFGPDQLPFFEEHQFKVILSHISFGEIPHPHLSITCLRHPVQRIISHYYHFDYLKTQHKMIHELTSEELSSYVATHKAILIRMSGCDDIETALNNLQKIDIVLLLENMDSDIVQLNSVLNELFEANITLEHLRLNDATNKPSVDDLQKDEAWICAHDFLEDELKIYEAACKLDRFAVKSETRQLCNVYLEQKKMKKNTQMTFN